jgi:glycosyltransferase involved in cell wall biosynthesis
MKLLIVSPYHGGSHKAWAEGFGRFSKHEIELIKLPARFWKWRMHGAAVTLARRFNEAGHKPDIIMTTDMLDLTTFLSLTRTVSHHIPVVLYMHENQLTYPLPADKRSGPMRRQLGERDLHYAFINYASMMAADQIWFNSRYHLDSLFSALPNFLKHFPDYNELGSLKKLEEKSEVLPVGIDLQRLNQGRLVNNDLTEQALNPLILWNQRWEYDKNPPDFFSALDVLAGEGIPFRVAICGQQFGKQPAVFDKGLEKLGERVYHFGYADPETYARLLWESDITISTAYHEFFGISILEAIYSHTFPILPARLSYPELLPTEFHQACLYQDFEDMVVRLRKAVLDIQNTRHSAALLSEYMVIYDWRNLADKYDTCLANLIF